MNTCSNTYFLIPPIIKVCINWHIFFMFFYFDLEKRGWICVLAILYLYFLWKILSLILTFVYSSIIAYFCVCFSNDIFLFIFLHFAFIFMIFQEKCIILLYHVLRMTVSTILDEFFCFYKKLKKIFCFFYVFQKPQTHSLGRQI